MKTSIVYIHYSSYTSNKCNILWRKLLLRKPKEAEFFSVMFSIIIWAYVGNHRLKFKFFFFFGKARGLCSRRIDGVKNEEMFQKWHILSSFILIWHTYHKIKILKSAICFVSLIAIHKAKFYNCCRRHNVSGSISGRLVSHFSHCLGQPPSSHTKNRPTNQPHTTHPPESLKSHALK